MLALQESAGATANIFFEGADPPQSNTPPMANRLKELLLALPLPRQERHGADEVDEERETVLGRERSLRQGKLRCYKSLRRLRGHTAVAVVLLLALAGWGAYAQAVLSRQKLKTELHRQMMQLTAQHVGRLTEERDRALEQHRTLRSELEISKAQLAAAQRGITGLISALERSRAELSALK